MEITDSKLEWATVDRMQKMLMNIQGDYKVTQAYSLFTGILCWVMQRIRREDVGLFDELRLELAVDDPWNLRLGGDCPHFSNIVIARQGWNIDGLNASDLLVGLRNAVAHGDGGRIRPANSEGLLVGQVFSVSVRDARMDITLRRADMIHIGGLLASRFCEALSRHQPESDFADSSARILEEGELA